MKNKKQNLGRNPLLNAFKMLYDEQFPRMRSCFILEKTEEEIRGIEKGTGVLVSYLLTLGVILVVIEVISFIVALQNKGWGDSHAFWATTCMIIISLISLFAFSLTKNQLNVNRLKRLEALQTRNGFDYFKDARNLFLEIFDKNEQEFIESFDTQTPKTLKARFERKFRALVRFIKSTQDDPEYFELNTEELLAKGHENLKKIGVLICLLGLMDTDRISVITGDGSNLISMRADWLYRKVFDETDV